MMKIQFDKKDVSKVKLSIKKLEKSFQKDFIAFGGSTEKISVKGYQEIQNNIRREKYSPAFPSLSPSYLSFKKKSRFPLRMWEKTSGFINALSRFRKGRSYWAGVRKGIINKEGNEISSYVLENESIRPILRTTAFGVRGIRSFGGNGFQSFADSMWIKSIRTVIKKQWKKS